MSPAIRRRSGLLGVYVATVFVVGVPVIVEALFSLHRSPVP